MSKALPTLLIKGEVVSVDSNDPAATLLKVKDRYGFETPIFLTTDTKVTQGDATTTLASLSAGVPVEVEYNFDVNTAKRHAVSVKLTTPGEAAAPSAPAVPAAVSAPAPTTTPEAAATPAEAPAEAPAPTPAPAEPAAAAPAPSDATSTDQPAAATPAPAAAATTQ